MEKRQVELYELCIEELARVALLDPSDPGQGIKIGDKLRALELLGKQLSSERSKQAAAPVLIYGGDDIAD